MKVDQRGSAVLDEEECRHLLESAADAAITGRIAINGARSPYVVPVNFTIVDGGIMIRLGPGWAAFHLNGVAVTFEVDQATASQHFGWSVVVQGVSRVVTYDEIGRLGRNLPTPLVTEPGVRVFEIVPFKVTGRLVEPDLRGEHQDSDFEVNDQRPVDSIADAATPNIRLDREALEEVDSLLHATLADLSSEIAGTDNPEYRRSLQGRRSRLEAIKAQLTIAGLT